MTEQIAMFIPITKVNAQRREVWGWAAIEEPDNSDEILDYESSKPHFLDWSNRAQKRSGGKSLGNVRSMHQNVAAGKLIELRPDDVSKGFYVGAQIIDEGEWKKVESGVYTGFSVGGSYLKRWQDFRNPGKMRYTAKPTELSIVDSPCIPSATFEMLKMDGSKALRKFQPAQGKNMIKVVTSDRFIKVEWDESKHPRAKDGKFGSGGGGGGGESKLEAKPKSKQELDTAEQNRKIYYTERGDYRRELPPDKPGELGGIRTRIKDTEGMFPNEADPKQSIDDEEDSLVDSKYEGAAKNPTSRTNPTPKEVTERLSSQSSGGKEESNENVARNAKPGAGEKPPNEWGSAKYSDPQATARQQRHSLFDVRDQDGKKVIMRDKKTGDAFAISVREARHALFDEPQDEESRWHIYDAGDSANAEGLWKPGESRDEYRGRVKQQVSDARNADTMPGVSVPQQEKKDSPYPGWDEEMASIASRDKARAEERAKKHEYYASEASRLDSQINSKKVEQQKAYMDGYVSRAFSILEEIGELKHEKLRAENKRDQFKDEDYHDKMPGTKPDKEITKGDVMNKLERIYEILDDIEEELQKTDVPDSPEPIADIPLKGEHGSYEVEQMPAPNVLMELKANSEPSQEVLATHAVKTEDLTDAFEAWLPKVGKMVKSIVAEALAETAIDLEKSAPARIIKVKKNEGVR